MRRGLRLPSWVRITGKGCCLAEVGSFVMLQERQLFVLAGRLSVGLMGPSQAGFGVGK